MHSSHPYSHNFVVYPQISVSLHDNRLSFHPSDSKRCDAFYLNLKKVNVNCKLRKRKSAFQAMSKDSSLFTAFRLNDLIPGMITVHLINRYSSGEKKLNENGIFKIISRKKKMLQDRRT